MNGAGAQATHSLAYRLVIVAALAWLLVNLARLSRAAESGATVRYVQHRVGKVVISVPEHELASSGEIRLWLHLHGAPAVMEANFAEFGAPGILANLTLPGLSKVYADHFSDGAVFPELLREIEALLSRLAPGRARKVGRIVVSSFSAGFGGVRQLLRQAEALDRIDALVMADSIYCGYAGDPALRQVDPELMSGFLRYARLAADGKRSIVISHSRQIPEGYASTTETADYLIRQLDGTRIDAQPGDWPGGLRPLTRFSRGKLEILGFDGEAPDDHMRHLRAIGSLLRRALPE